ncbi:MAG: DUF2399 domain-containing protein [Candidatus Binatia bacterium]
MRARGRAQGPHAAPLGRRLDRAPAASPWEPALASAMGSERRAVHEELVAETLLADLGAESAAQIPFVQSG